MHFIFFTYLLVGIIVKTLLLFISEKFMILPISLIANGSLLISHTFIFA